jgi:DNA-binding MarR family transcriptional regulator
MSSARSATDPGRLEDAADPSGPDPLRLELQVCFALALASRGVIGVYRPLLEPLQLTHPQYLVMLALWQETPLTVTRLAELLQLEPATLSPLLKRLETTGYIDRRRDPKDERALQVTLTDAGRQLRNDALAIPPAVMERLELTRTELEALHDHLSQLIARVRKT